MRILVAPDKFAGTLSAVQAAEAIAEGWRSHAPRDELVLAPMSDGGPGFVEVIEAALAARGESTELVTAQVAGPFGAPVPTAYLVAGDTAYVESAQACGLHLTTAPDGTRHGDPEAASTYGVGELLRAATSHPGVRRVVVGLGGSGTTDAGAGMWAAWGAGPGDLLRHGSTRLAELTSLDLPTPAGARSLPGFSGDLVAASDVENPLTGLFGAAKIYGPQKGIAEERLPAVDAALEHFARLADPAPAREKGAGAAGGLGYGLLLGGASREPGIGMVARAAGVDRLAGEVDLVLTGEGAFDFSSRAGKVPYGVAQLAAEALRPCVAIAGQVLIGSREMRTMGVESAYAVGDTVGLERSLADPYDSLARTAARVARTWSR